MQRSTETTPPALAEVRHELECEPDDRRIQCVCFPVAGGKYRVLEYGKGNELPPVMFREAGVLGEAYRLCNLAAMWEEH